MASDEVSVRLQNADFSERHQSLREHWHPGYIAPREMAASGFYALVGSGGETRCFSCGLLITDWHRFSNPWLPHYLRSPRCPHLNAQLATSGTISLINLVIRPMRQMLRNPSQLSAAERHQIEGILFAHQQPGALQQLLQLPGGVESALQFHQPRRQMSGEQLLQLGSDCQPQQTSDARGICSWHQPSVPYFETSKTSSLTCRICFENRLQVLLLPCRHLCCCRSCFNGLTNDRCPICRTCISAALTDIRVV